MLNFDEIVRMLDDELTREGTGETLSPSSVVADGNPFGANTDPLFGVKTTGQGPQVLPNPLALDNSEPEVSVPTLETLDASAPKVEKIKAKEPDASKSSDVEKKTDTDGALSEDSPSPAASGFLGLLQQNQQFRDEEDKRHARMEKQNRSRKTIAAISDALSSLGNLVGTTYGAASQQQTYQMPFINEQTEADRALHRATIDRLRSEEQSLKLAQAKQEAAAAGDASALALQELKNQGALNTAMVNGEYSLQRTKMNNDTSRANNADTIKAAGERNDKSIRAANARNAANIASREKIAADKIAQLDRAAEAKKNNARAMTKNKQADVIMKDAEMAVLSELKPEVEAVFKERGEALPFDWQKNWRQYVQLAPNFYKKFFVDKGWGTQGGTIADVESYGSDDDDLALIGDDEDNLNLK